MLAQHMFGMAGLDGFDVSSIATRYIYLSAKGSHLNGSSLTEVPTDLVLVQ